MYFHNSLIPRGAYFLLPLESKQEATTGWNFTKCISEVKVNQLKVKNMHVEMGIFTFKHVYSQQRKQTLNMDFPPRNYLNTHTYGTYFYTHFIFTYLFFIHTYIAWSWKKKVPCVYIFFFCIDYVQLEIQVALGVCINIKKILSQNQTETAKISGIISSWIMIDIIYCYFHHILYKYFIYKSSTVSTGCPTKNGPGQMLCLHMNSVLKKDCSFK